MSSIEKGEYIGKIGKNSTSNPTVQVTGTPPIIVIDQGKSDEEKENTTKDED